jgi:hypothetical protein
MITEICSRQDYEVENWRENTILMFDGAAYQRYTFVR